MHNVYVTTKNGRMFLVEEVIFISVFHVHFRDNKGNLHDLTKDDFNLPTWMRLRIMHNPHFYDGVETELHFV